MVFSIWTEENKCLSWQETEEWCSLLGLCHVPVLYKGAYDEALIKQIAEETVSRGGEGIVVRLENAFAYEEFALSIAKFVRENHLQTDSSWGSVIEKNDLKREEE